ncbi:hypothetical protein Aple_012590 [Acrocarpospora pleiomorpha]|uniref:Uncharacterized protein n=2 Tax=Acrocarpospora pleiomorpha TaxID=90975 RepID=A0A5M3XB35_9ACTN|nr:hypothetical protein Aple_012590 [Acrocarpospora pleiomorpha]
MSPPRDVRTRLGDLLANPPIRSMSEQLALLNQLQRMTPQVRAIFAAGRAPRSFARDPRELIDPSGLCVRSGWLQNAFEAVREDFPNISIEGFLAGGDSRSLLYAVVDA